MFTSVLFAMTLNFMAPPAVKPVESVQHHTASCPANKPRCKKSKKPKKPTKSSGSGKGKSKSKKKRTS